MDGTPRLYGELAPWWPLMSAPADYAEEAAFYFQAIADACARRPGTMLELGSGGGNNASHMKAHARMVLVDLSPGMLEVSRALNPECEHHQGDMRTVRLGRQFDAVFVHDAVCYLTDERAVRQAIDTAFAHCRPGGAVLFAPDYTRENFQPGTDDGGHDASDGRGLRYIEWVWDFDPSDSVYTVDYAYLLRSSDGSMRAVHDRHIEGLFARGDWLAWMGQVGFDARAVPFEHSELPAGAHEVFVGAKPE